METVESVRKDLRAMGLRRVKVRPIQSGKSDVTERTLELRLCGAKVLRLERVR